MKPSKIVEGYDSNMTYTRKYVFGKLPRIYAVIFKIPDDKELAKEINDSYYGAACRLAHKALCHYTRNASENRARHERMVTGKHGAKRPR